MKPEWQQLRLTLLLMKTIAFISVSGVRLAILTFEPFGLTAAHKYLPLPMYVKVTNLENDRSIIVRVNDRGPFPSRNNPKSGDRIIDLSMGAAKRLGFYKKGTASVKVEAIQIKEIG